jgi:AcrR family transcriptional regulator
MAAKQSSRANAALAEKPAPNRGPKPSLSRGEIASAAIRLADKNGLAAVTMQRLAQEVGLTTMAIYRYFSGKDEVIALMIDSVADSSLYFGKPSLPWSTRLRRWAHCCLEIYQNHPWFLEATTARQSPVGPNELAWMEAALAMLTESGLEPKKRYHAFFAIIGLVRGHATFLDTKRKAESKEWKRALAQTLQQQSNQYPALLEVSRLGGFSESTSGAFDFGLDCILDGIRVQVSGTV